MFKPYVTYDIYSDAEAVAIGDVNGDGRNDVVLTSTSGDTPEYEYNIFVYLQNENGGLDSPITYATTGSYTNRPESIDIGDVNNDGKNDVVIGNLRQYIEVFLQNTSGGLDPGVTYLTNNSASIKIGDLNNDGRLDVAALSWGTDNDLVDVFLQNTSGTLDDPVSYTVRHGGYDEIEVGDVNNDDLTDIIVMSGQGYAYDNIGILLQQPSGTFAPAVYYDLGGDELTSGVAVGDINNDNLKDIIVTYGGNRPDSFLGVFSQNSSNTLDTPVSYPAYDCPESVAIGDFNLDGKDDVALLHGGWENAGVYLQGDSGLSQYEELYSIPYATHYNPQGLAVEDINSDGTDDIVIADYNNGLVVLYGAPPVVLGTDPSNNALDVPLDKTLSINFSKYIQKGTEFAGISINSGDTVVDYTYGINGSVLTLDPATNLEPGTNYTVSIPAGAVQDPAGNGLETGYTFTFTTISANPAVIGSDPSNGAINVPVNKILTINFSESVQSTVNFSDITLSTETTVVDYTYSLNGDTLTLTPESNLAYSTAYTLLIPYNAIADLEGNTMLADKAITFTTQAAPSSGGDSDNDNSTSGSTTSDTTPNESLTDSVITTTTQKDGQTITTVDINENTALETVNQNPDGSTVTIPVNENSDVVSVKINPGPIYTKLRTLPWASIL